MIDSELKATKNRHPGLNELSDFVDAVVDISDGGADTFDVSGISSRSVHFWICLRRGDSCVER
jgi:hypothetical protein